MEPARILCADADSTFRRNLSEAFRRQAVPVTVVEAGTGAEALDRIAADAYDFLVCERNLPDLPCEKFLPLVRKTCPDLPVLVLLPHEDPKFVDRAAAFGATEARPRPRDVETLCGLIQNALHAKKLAEETQRHSSRTGKLVRELRDVGKETRRLVDRIRGANAPRDSLPSAGRRPAEGLPEDASFLRALLDSEGLLVLVLDPQGRVVYFNRACQTLTGYGPDDVRGKQLREFLLLSAGESESQRVDPRLADGTLPGRQESTWVARDGTTRLISWSNTLVRSEDGSVRFVVVTGADVTPAPGLEQRTGLLEAIVSSFHDAIIAQALDGVVVHWNPGAEQVFGYSAQEILGGRLSDFFAAGAPCTVDVLADRFRRGETCGNIETRCRRKDGREIQILCTPSPILDSRRQLIGISIIARDVSERDAADRRRDAEERVTRSLSLALTLATAAPGLLEEICESLGWPIGELWSVDEDVGILRHLHTWHRSDLKLSEFVQASKGLTFAPGVGLAGAVWAERRPIWVQDVSEDPRVVRVGPAKLAGLRAAFAFPIRVRDRVLGVLSFFHHEALRPDKELLKTMESIGSLIGLLIERNRAVRAVAGQESRVRAIVETAADGIIAIDERGTIDSFNAAAERLFGYPAGEVVGKNVSTLMPEPYRAEHDGYVARYVRTGEKTIIGKGREVVGRRKDGSTFPLYLSVSEMLVDGRRMFTGIVRDLSELKSMQEEVVRSRSLAAIGEASAAIAHEIKNPLAAISAPLQIIQDGLPSRDARREILGDVVRQVKRLDGTVRQLLLLSKPWIPKKELCDVAGFLQRMVSSIEQQELFRRVRVTLQAEGSLAVPLDPALIEQVLWNLLQNAAQAMSGEGEIRVETKSTVEVASIVVSDNGPGMTPDVQAKLFRPFFTTKASGTGLGLSISRKIVDAHGGALSIESSPGRGTRITLTLPRR